jgi:tripartite-type tricarboxylate transporter receptor subunit TctC
VKLRRRKFLHLAAGAAALPAVSRIAWAQAYPARTVTIIVPVAAGGTTDVATRIIGEYMSRLLGQQFIVENVTGAGGTTGSTRAMRARPDGYTIMMGHTGTHAFSTAFYPNLAYRPDVDFEPIGEVLEIPELIVARRDFPPKDLKEFIAYVRENAEKLNVAHAGVGSLLFTYALLLNSLLGVKPTMVPFTGAAPAANALIGGQVDYMLNGISEVGQQALTGTVKAYAIAAMERHPTLPDVPTTLEAGLPEFLALPWFGLFAPKGVPQPILDKLTEALDRTLNDDNVRKRLLDLGGNIPSKAKRGQQQLATLVKGEIARWTPIIRAANVKAESRKIPQRFVIGLRCPSVCKAAICPVTSPQRPSPQRPAARLLVALASAQPILQRHPAGAR